MPDASNPPVLLVVFEITCWLSGIVLGVRWLAGRLGPKQPLLKPWTIPVEGFFTGALLIILGGLLLPHAATYLSDDLLGRAAREGDWWMIVQGAAFQLGLLSGAVLGALILSQWKRPDSVEDQPVIFRKPPPILAGLITFLIALPLIGGIGLAWKALLEFFGHSVNEQEMVDLFRNADDPALLVWMIVLAAIIAPVTEELIFRAGLFRYLRTRIPRVFALILPALIFASLHGNLAAFLPLFALGVFFALAYERSGSIAVPMIAHALFNLHTIVLVMAGVTG